MSFQTARRDIEKRVADNWATTVVAYENVKFTPPSADTSWVRVRIFEDDVNRINIGMPGLHRTTGTIAIEIYTPINIGTKTVRDYADTFGTLFRDVQFSGITCREAKLEMVGESNGWFQANVLVPFYWDGLYS